MGKQLSTAILLILICLRGNIGFAQTCSVNAGVNSRICKSGTMTLTGNATGALSASAQWEFISGPNIPLISSPSSASTAVTGFIAGTYRFRYFATCSDLIEASDTVEIIVDSLGAFSAGGDTFICSNTRVLSATLPAGATGIWTYANKSSGPLASFSNASAPNSSFTAMATPSCPREYYTIWTVTSGACTAVDTSVTSFGGQNPGFTSLSHTDTTICGTNYLSPIIEFPGCGATYNSVQLAGPSIATWSNSYGTSSTALRFQYSGLTTGTYTFALFVQTCSGNIIRDTFTITVATTTGVTNPGISNYSLCPSQFDTVYYSTPTNTLLPGEHLVYNFSSLSGNTPGKPTILPTIDTIGNVLRWRNVVHPDTTAVSSWQYSVNYYVTNGSCVYTGTALIILVPPMSSRAFQTVVNLPCGATSGEIAVPVSGGYGGYAFTNGTILSKPAGAPNPTLPASVTSGTFPVSGLQPGKYVISFQYFIGNSGCSLKTAVVEVNVSAKAGLSNAGTDQTLPCGVDSTVLAGNIPAAGNTGIWQLVSGPSGVLLSTPTSPSLLVKNLVSGTYIFRWSISNGGTCTASTSDIKVIVTPNLPTANAGADKTVCFGSPTSLNGNDIPAGGSGKWRQISGPSVTITDSTAATTLINGTTASNTYGFSWTITTPCGVAADTVVIATTSDLGPSAAQIISNDTCVTTATLSSISLNALAPVSGSGIWRQISGPVTVSIAAPGSAGTSASGFSATGLYRFTWTVGNGTCDSLRDTLTISFRGAASLVANAGADRYICADTIRLAGNNPTLGTGTWVQFGGGASIIDSVNKSNSLVSGLVGGSTYDYIWIVSLGNCPSSRDTVHIGVSQNPSTAVARTDTVICGITLSTTATLSVPISATAPTIGVGAWTILETPTGGATITSPGSTNTTATLYDGITRLVWQVSNGACPASRDTVNIEIVPKASAGGATSSQCNKIALTLSGTEAGSGSPSWTQSSGPSTANISNPNRAVTTVSGLIPGTYVFRYTITHPVSGCSSADSVRVINYALPVANAGTDTSYCYLAAGNPVWLQAPTPALGTGTWSRSSGTGTLSYSPSASANPATALITGASALQQFRWTVTNGVCQASDIKDVIIERIPPPGVIITPLNSCRDTITFRTNSLNPGFLYTWSVPKGTLKDTAGINLWGPLDNQLLLADTNSVYLTVTNPASGCSTMDSASVIVDCFYLPLPLGFQSISVDLDHCNKIIRWKFNDREANAVSSFTIERSTDGKQFTSIATLPAGEQQFIDVAYIGPENLYRIKVILNDLSTLYSPVQSVKTTDCEPDDVKVYPIPANEFINLQWPDKQLSAAIQIYDMKGALQFQKSLPTGGASAIKVDMLREKIYLMRITYGEYNKIIKLELNR